MFLKKGEMCDVRSNCTAGAYLMIVHTRKQAHKVNCYVF